MRRTGTLRDAILVGLCLLIGTGLGYHTRAPAPMDHRQTPAVEAPIASVPTPTIHRHQSATDLTSAATPPAAPPPSASFPALPPPGPIREHLDELRERAQRGDRAAARRAHRDLQYCAEAREALRFVGDTHKAQASCVVERLCSGLRGTDLVEAGAFLMRAAELGDPDAMAAVVRGQAVDSSAAGMRRLSATRALAPVYLRRALEAGSPIAMYTVVTGICAPTDPVTGIPFDRGFPPEERLAWYHAIRPMVRRPLLRDFHQPCSERWPPGVAARAEARGRALQAQFYATRRDLPESAEAGWQRALTELGQFKSHGEDPRWADFPECAG